MGIYDMASAIRQPDASGLSRGIQAGQQMADRRRQNQARNALARLQQGDTSAMAELQQADPDAAQKYGEFMRTESDRKQMASFFKPAQADLVMPSGSPVDNALSVLAGGNMTPQIKNSSPASFDAMGLTQFMASRGNSGALESMLKMQSPETGQYGMNPQKGINPATGKVEFFVSNNQGIPRFLGVGDTPETPKAPTTRTLKTGGREVTQEWNGSSWVTVADAPREMPKPEAPKLIETANGWEVVRPGQLPTGKPKPVGGNAAPTEDERKAAGWKSQMDKAISDMDAATKLQSDADIPGYVESIPLMPDVAKNASRTPARQKFVQASGAFAEAALRAATGAGINESEAKQKIAELTPQLGDSKEVRAQKRESLYMYLDSVTKRAGRAIPQNAASTGAPAKAGGPGWKVAGYPNILAAHADYKRGRDAAYKAGNMDLVRQIDAAAREDGVIK